MIKKMILIYLLGVICSVDAHPTEFKRDWNKMYRFYSGLLAYSFNMTMEVKFNGQFHSKVSIESVINDTNSNSVIDGKIRSINGPKHAITIDQEQGIMTINNRTTQLSNIKKEIMEMKDTGFIVDTVLTIGDKRTYRLSYLSGQIRFCELTIDTISGMVSRYLIQSRFKEEYDWKKSGLKTVVMVFSNFQSIENIDIKQFELDTYATNSKKTGYKAKSPYQDCKVLDMNIKKRGLR